uniref:Uncharacterized protein n=1 Tax=Picea glauca TaxID=3330 RepID=A0A101M3A0_PICGL|nr:hypothetical protein ABT39_MTgene109 [Picea glauca]
MEIILFLDLIGRLLVQQLVLMGMPIRRLLLLLM